jgi:hypothetical protein
VIYPPGVCDEAIYPLPLCQVGSRACARMQCGPGMWCPALGGLQPALVHRRPIHPSRGTARSGQRRAASHDVAPSPPTNHRRPIGPASVSRRARRTRPNVARRRRWRRSPGCTLPRPPPAACPRRCSPAPRTPADLRHGRPAAHETRAHLAHLPEPARLRGARAEHAHARADRDGAPSSRRAGRAGVRVAPAGASTSRTSPCNSSTIPSPSTWRPGTSSRPLLARAAVPRPVAPGTAPLAHAANASSGARRDARAARETGRLTAPA